MGILVLLAALSGASCTSNRDPVMAWGGAVDPLDRTRPQVLFTLPATAQPPVGGVYVGTTIAATFTESMAPATLNPATFTVTGPWGMAVGGSITYLLRTATFTPTFSLPGETIFTVTITEATTDLAGNGLSGNQAPLPLPSSYIWTFTTGPAAVPIPLSLGMVQAFGQLQASADGSIRNDVVAGEPVPARPAFDPSQTVQLRHGFHLPPAR
ncbi:MAG: Ig-like domain-containing protein [Holophaga sp.]|nr:Ig-like domain-containing protein [Holophaga sp.]